MTKHLFNIVFGTIVLFGFSQCGSSQQLVSKEKLPFSLGKVVYEKWTVKDSDVHGVNVHLPITVGDAQIDSVYFRNSKVKPERVKRGNYLVYIARFKDSPKDVIMNSDMRSEAANQLSTLPQKMPFELKDNEVLIRFTRNNRSNYFKVDDVTESTSVEYKQLPYMN